MMEYNHTMSVEELRGAMLAKKADALKTNEENTNKSVGDVHTPPADRAPGTLDAKWGDRPPVNSEGDPAVYSDAVKREAQDGRDGMLTRLLDSINSSAPAEQALISQSFANASKAESHSPVLQHGHAKIAAADETLTDTVLRVVGHL